MAGRHAHPLNRRSFFRAPNLPPRLLGRFLGVVALTAMLFVGSNSADAAVTPPPVLKPAAVHVVKGGCRLSAHWYVNTDAVWAGSRLDYTRVTRSPGALHTSSQAANATYAIATGHGTEVEQLVYWANNRDGSYVYRADFPSNKHNSVTVVVSGGSATCAARMNY